MTPKGNSYHKTGIIPKYECENIIGEFGEDCAAQLAHKLYNVKIPKQRETLAKQGSEFVYYNTTNTIAEFEGGAIEWYNEDTYLKKFLSSQVK